MVATRWILPASIALLALTVLVGTGQAGIGHNHIQGFNFSPKIMTVVVGDTVEWDQHDNGALHTATDIRCPRAGGPGPCEFDSNPGGGGMVFNQFFSHTFATSGTITYLCTVHGFTGTMNIVNATGGADLAVDAVVVGTATVPSQKTIDVTVRNQGDTASGASSVRVSYFYKNLNPTIATVAVGGLAPGATQTVSTTWDAALKLGDFRIWAKADSGLAVAELSEHNNDGFAIASVLLPPGTQPGRDLTNP